MPFSERLQATATQCNGMLVKPNPIATAADTAQRSTRIYTHTAYTPLLPQEQSFHTV